MLQLEKSSAEDALKQVNKPPSAGSSTTTTESKDVHKVGRQLAKAQAKTRKAYETLKKMKEDWTMWTGQIQELYNRKVAQYEEAHRAWTLVLQDAITAEKKAKEELQALGQQHADFKWDDIELEEKELPAIFQVPQDFSMGTESTELALEPVPPPKGTLPKDTPPETFSEKLAKATAAHTQKRRRRRRKKKPRERRKRMLYRIQEPLQGRRQEIRSKSI